MGRLRGPDRPSPSRPRDRRRHTGARAAATRGGSGRYLAGDDAADAARSHLADRTRTRTTAHAPDDVTDGDARTTSPTPSTDAHRTSRPSRGRSSTSPPETSAPRRYTSISSQRPTPNRNGADRIVANWPHVVELEQLDTLIAAQPALAHWPTAVPPPVQAWCSTPWPAPPLPHHRGSNAHWPRSTRKPRPTTPFDRLKQGSANLDQLATRVSTSAERGAVDEAVRAAHIQLRQARPRATRRRRLRPIWRERSRRRRRATHAHPGL